MDNTSTDSNHAQRAGKAVGSFARRVKDAADQGKWIEKVWPPAVAVLPFMVLVPLRAR